MDDSAQIHHGIPLLSPHNLIFHIHRPHINIFGANTQHIRKGMVPQEAQVVFIHFPAPIGGHIGAARLYEGAYPLGIVPPVHVVKRRDHQRIIFQAAVHVHNIHIHPLLPERPEPGHPLFQEIQGVDDGLGILRRPPVFPVEDDSRPGPVAGLHHLVGKGFQALPQMGNLPEYPGVLPVPVIHHRAVEFFAAAPALPPLEVLDAV